MRILPLLLALIAVAVQAELYKSINQDGEVVYSDSPSPGARRLKLPELPTYALPPVGSLRTPSRVPIKNDLYERFVFAAPANDATIRDELGVIHTELQLVPGLGDDHLIQYYLDDKPYGPPYDQLTVTMSNLAPGRHRLSASVIDRQGNILISTEDIVVTIERE
ncbi:MAG: DUF4124 domain-containing protein [Gammaproteobacteria bacterium]|jgi:hypothetical protein